MLKGQDDSVGTPKPHAGSLGPDLRIFLLGRFEVQVGARPVVGFARANSTAAALLQLLALAPSHRLHRDEVLDVLWPELEADAAMNNLHNRLHALRKVLEPERPPGTPSAFISLQHEVLVLHAPGGLWIDTEAFELACTIANGTRDAAAHEAARQLYAGDLLPDDGGPTWKSARGVALRAQYLSLLLQLATIYEQNGEVWAAIRTLAELVDSESCHEEAHVRLMSLYAQAGQRHRALRQYQLLVRALTTHLNTAPDVRTQQTYEAIVASRVASTRSATPMPAPTWARSPLTPREEQVFSMMAEGRSNRFIAERLQLSVRTVDTHVTRILNKMGMSSREQVVGGADETEATTAIDE